MWINKLKQTTLPLKILVDGVYNQYKFDDSYFLVDLDSQTPSYVWMHSFNPYTLMAAPPFRTNTDWSVQLAGVNDFTPILSHLEIADPVNTSYCQVSSPFAQSNQLEPFYVITTSQTPTLTAHVKYTFINVIDSLSLYRLLFSDKLVNLQFISDRVNTSPAPEEVSLLIKANPEHEVHIDMSYPILENGSAKHVFNYLLEHSQVRFLVFNNDFNIVDVQSVAKYKNRYLKNLPINSLSQETGSTFLPEHILCRI